ncbi:hypothetical protein C8R47DRAFT_1787 [Mycena vitilis]|nr:hypothetical protein C8R47DRAFT_1787 [Mycena vitilis]
MLSAVSTLLLAAAIVHSSPMTQSASSTSKRGFNDVSYQGLGPRPWGTLAFDARSPNAEGGEWFRYVDGGVGVGVTPGNQVGWRLTNDTNTEIVFYWKENPVFLNASYTGTNDNKPNIQTFATVGAATFSSSANNNASTPVDDALWTNNTGGAVVPWTYGIGVTNGCDHRIVVITTVDASGNSTTVTGTGEIDVDFPSLPVNVTVYFQDSPADVTSISYFPTDTLTYKVGAGSNQPTVPAANLGTGIYWCDID